MSVFSLIGVRIFWLANKDLNLCILILKSLNISNVGNLVGGYSLLLTMYLHASHTSILCLLYTKSHVVMGIPLLSKVL